jgi:glutamate synthase domain-containing protein 3
MTNGRAVILGTTGRNFAAGMSGGIAYVFDPKEEFLTRCNLAMVELEKLTKAGDIAELREMIQEHYELTGSPVAEGILHSWEVSLKKFHKVMPIEYRRALEQLAKGEKEQVGHG